MMIRLTEGSLVNFRGSRSLVSVAIIGNSSASLPSPRRAGSVVSGPGAVASSGGLAGIT